VKFLRRTESDSDSLRSLCDKIVGNLLVAVIYGFVAAGTFRGSCHGRQDVTGWQSWRSNL
jgi:hypothetical protein